MVDGELPVGDVMDGAGADWTVSADAMRWSPRASGAADYPGVDCGTGFGEALRPHLRRLAARVAAPFAEVAADMLDELRGLRRPGVLRRGFAARP